MTPRALQGAYYVECAVVATQYAQINKTRCFFNVKGTDIVPKEELEKYPAR